MRWKDATDGDVESCGCGADCDGKDEKGKIVRGGCCGKTTERFVGCGAERLVGDVCGDGNSRRERAVPGLREGGDWDWEEGGTLG